MNLIAAQECWMQTYTGKKFFPLNPKAEDIDIRDIAHSLSTSNRFGGHLRRFYSVGSHSLHVSDLCVGNRLQGLMHDATEAYLGDMIRPLKFCFPEFKTYETQLWEAIAFKFGIDPVLRADLKYWDNVALITERHHLGNCAPVDSWGEELEDLKPRDQLKYDGDNWPMHRVEQEFLDRFHALTDYRFTPRFDK